MYVIAVGMAQTGNDSADARNMIALGKQERTKCFPGILAKDSDSRAESNRFCCFFVDGNDAAYPGVIAVQIKIGAPKTVELRF